MIYYVALAIIDISFFLNDHWKELTFTALASGIGVILGKRIGVKFAVNYIMKYMGMQQKSLTELQVEHHESEIVKLGGQPWIAPISKPYKINIRRVLFKRSIWSRTARFIVRFTKLRTILRRKKKMSISRKLLMAVFGAVILVLNQQLGWTLDPSSIIGVGSFIISYIIGQSMVDTNGLGQYAPLLEKLKSKKLWTALIGSIVIVFNDTYHWGMNAESIYMLAGTGVSFIIGKSAISVIKAGGSDAKYSSNDGPAV